MRGRRALSCYVEAARIVNNTPDRPDALVDFRTGARLAVPGGVVAAALVAAVSPDGEQDDEEDDDYRNAHDDTPMHFVPVGKSN